MSVSNASEFAICFRCQTPVRRDRGDRGLDGELYCRYCPGRWSP